MYQYLARELLGRPCYVLLQSEWLGTAPIFAMAGGVLGATHEHLDLALEDTLRARVAWRGRRPAVVLFDSKVRGLGLPEWATRRVVLTVLCHELAHVVCHGVAAREQDKIDREVDRLAACVAIHNTARVQETGQRGDLPPWLGHDPKWLRTALHLCYRAWLIAGVAPAIDLLFDADALALPAPRRFARALGDEPRRLVNRPVEAINETNPPRRFTALHVEAAARWILTQRKEK